MNENRQPFGGGRAVGLALGAIALVVALVMLVVRAGEGGRSAAPEAPQPPMTTVMIVSEPAGATITRPDGGVLGKSPLTLTLPKSDGDLVVIVSLDGYQSRRSSVPLFSQSGRVDVALSPNGVDAAVNHPPPPDGWTP
jgi:hypothetical protein